MLSIAIAHAKFILSGEHFVLGDTPGFVLPAPCFMTQVTIEDRTKQGIAVKLSFENNTEVDMRSLEAVGFRVLIGDLVRKMAEMIGLNSDVLALTVSVKSNIPPGQGAGSSSSLCQAIAEAMLKHFICNDIRAHYLYSFGRILEDSFHGPVSGIDNAAIAYQRPLFFARMKKLVPAVFGGPFYFAVGSTGPRSGRSPYDIVTQFQNENRKAYEHIQCDTVGCTIHILQAILDGNAAMLGEDMTNSQRMYAEMGLSTPKIDSAIQTAMHAGAYGARLTGAGCGGFVIACVPENKIEEICRAWNKLGLSSVRTLACLPNYK